MRRQSLTKTAACLFAAPLLTGLLLAARPATAEEPAAEAIVDLAAIDALIDDADRSHWAFQPVVRPEVPAVQDTAWPRNEIDHFILAALEQKGWRPSAPAEPRALLRRVYLDLIGLPPTPEEQRAWLADPSPEAYERIVNKLLARAQYAERWARHWLDLVRYADSNGFERDAAKPNVWRYRDWVIRSLLIDKPLDRFILEQLAADELPDSKPQDLFALGYYRLGPWDDEPADFAEDRYDQLDDIVSTTGLVFLGQTIGCCRCHNHKFEPLTQHDYYRLVAVFNGLVRPQNGRTELDLPVGSPEEIAAVEARDRQIAEWEKEIAALEDGALRDFLLFGTSTLPAEAMAAFRQEREKRSAEQNELVRQHQEQFEKEVEAHVPQATREAILDRQVAIEQLRAEVPDLPRGYFMVEPQPAAPSTFLLLRGKAGRPGPQVQPGLPTVLVSSQPQFPPAGEKTSLRRLTLARWIASPDNPLTARVLVNRVWQYHFGEGLVRTPSDFGVMGDAPTHPELLDWLADWFVRDAGWSLKKLHRLILASNTYRMSKAWNEEYGAADPENRLLWRFPYRRLEVEAIRDSMLAAAGTLNPRVYGPPMYPHVPPEALEGHSDPKTIWPQFDEREASRRTIYAYVKRSLLVPMLEVLDFCDTARSTPQRVTTSVAPQALALLNGDFVNRQSRHFARRLLEEAGTKPAAQIDRAYELALCRPPTDSERAALVAFIEREAAALLAERSGTDKPIDEALAKRLALVQACRVVFNLNEFVYPD